MGKRRGRLRSPTQHFGGARGLKLELLQAYFRIKYAISLPLSDLSGFKLPVSYFSPISKTFFTGHH